MAKGPADAVDEAVRDLDLLAYRLERRVADPDRLIVERREVRREVERIRQLLSELLERM